MDHVSTNADREILEAADFGWTKDPEYTLTQSELRSVVKHFCPSDSACGKRLQDSIHDAFRSFLAMAITERIHLQNDKIEKAKKPSTIVAKELKQLSESCETLYKQLGDLNQSTKTWIDQEMERLNCRDNSDGQLTLRDLDAKVSYPLELLISMSRDAEKISSSGPNNMATRIMIERLANCWELYCDEPPTSDKGRGRRDDPFLELCQQMALLAHGRLERRGGGLGSLSLAGLVDDVLTKRRLER